MKNKNKIVGKVKSALPSVVKFMETYGFKDFDYGFLYGADEWEASFFKNEEDNEPSVYFNTKTLDELIYQLENYG